MLPFPAMLDPKTLSEKRAEILESCRRRGVNPDLGAAIAAQEKFTHAKTLLDDFNRQRNEHQQKGKGKLDPAAREAHTVEGRRLKDAAEAQEKAVAEAQAEALRRNRELPNFVDPESPVGGEDASCELRRVGAPRVFDFKPLDHLELGEKLGLLDFENATKVTGAKFYYLKNEAVLLDLALQRYALDVLLNEGFTPYTTPDLARPEILSGIGFNPRGPETQVYSIENQDLCLIGTSEITLGGLYSDSILAEEELPLKIAGISHCFRTEAGAHGRESRGLYRVHQFTKVEMFVFTTPEQSAAMHRELLRIEERIFQGLEIPYRVLDIATGDLGAPAYKKFDIEAWMPGRGDGGSYGEVTSTSNCTDFQSRRLGIRYRSASDKKNHFVHMLNGTAIAISRALIALLENHQQADGSIKIPKALEPYLGRNVIGRAAKA